MLLVALILSCCCDRNLYKKLNPNCIGVIGYFFPQGERHLPELLLWLDPVLAALPLPLMELNKLTAPVRLRIQNIVATLADGLTDGESGLGVEVLVELTE